MYPLYEGITELFMYKLFVSHMPIGFIEHVALIHIGETEFFSTAALPNE